MEHRSFDGSSLGASQSMPVAGVDWSQARGAFMLSGKLYTGWSDGRLYVRSFDGQTAGAPAALDLAGLTSVQFPVASVTGMFYDSGRLYYTVAGDARLFYRYFEPESGIVGAETFVASVAGDGLDWSSVRGMTLAGGHVYLARTDGNLYAVDLVAGRPAPATMHLVGAAPGLVSRGMFLLS
jgi:outer membrane protein assembly factor BamB